MPEKSGFVLVSLFRLFFVVAARSRKKDDESEWLKRVVAAAAINRAASIKARLSSIQVTKKCTEKLEKRAGRANETFAPLDRSLTFTIHLILYDLVFFCL